MWKSEGIICHCKANNVQNDFAFFWNYTQEEVPNMSKLELFLVFFPVGYLDTILILETNEVLKGPLDLGEFMRWVSFWLYMSCWVGIHEKRELCAVTSPVIHR